MATKDGWKTPDLHKQLLNPEWAREYIETFPWEYHGFPEGKPYAFMALVNGRNRKFYTHCKTDDEWVSCALAILLDLELDHAMQERMKVEFEI